VLLALILSSPSFARKTNFLESHKGLILGAGTYYHPTANDNLFDPVPELAPAGTDVAGSKNGYLLPIKVGLFAEAGTRAAIEVYFRYMMKTSAPFTASGGNTGTGKTAFSSWGGGGSLSIIAVRKAKVRMLLTLNGEYVFEKAKITFNNEVLSLSAPAMLIGLGVQPEVYLGDLYALSMFIGYQYGLAQKWSVAAAGTMFGQAYTAGALTSPLTGAPIKSQFGGLLLEANLRLNFF
jgi:hypothetical protein